MKRWIPDIHRLQWELFRLFYFLASVPCFSTLELQWNPPWTQFSSLARKHKIFTKIEIMSSTNETRQKNIIIFLSVRKITLYDNAGVRGVTQGSVSQLDRCNACTFFLCWETQLADGIWIVRDLPLATRLNFNNRSNRGMINGALQFSPIVIIKVHNGNDYFCRHKHLLSRSSHLSLSPHPPCFISISLNSSNARTRRVELVHLTHRCLRSVWRQLTTFPFDQAENPFFNQPRAFNSERVKREKWSAKCRAVTLPSPTFSSVLLFAVTLSISTKPISSNRRFWSRTVCVCVFVCSQATTCHLMYVTSRCLGTKLANRKSFFFSFYR